MPDETPLLEDPHHARANARMAARLISLGVVSQDVVEAVLKRAFVLAGQTGKPRDYAAVMGVPIAAARLEMERERLDLDKAHPQRGVSVNVGVMDWSGMLSGTEVPPAEAKLVEMEQAAAVELHPPGTNGDGKK